MRFVLVGAGGHAKAICEAIEVDGGELACYVDPSPATWLSAPQRTDDNDVEPGDGSLVLGIGGLQPAGLSRRLALFDGYIERGFTSSPIVHPAAHVSEGARIEAGTVVLAGAVVQPDARVGRAAIINTAAVVEHDSIIGAGSHLAPSSVVLGDCRVGECCMIGAGAIVLQGAVVPDGSLVRAGARFG